MIRGDARAGVAARATFSYATYVVKVLAGRELSDGI
jgi:hypothetical protein